jgi:hypothetical protein
MLNRFKYFLLTFLILAYSGCKKVNDNEETKMDEKNLASRLSEIKIMETKKLDSLSEEIKIKSRKETNELIKILHSGKEEEVKKTSMLLMSIGDLSITPLLDSLDSNNPNNYVWEADIALSLHLQNRKKISKIINSMLLDTRLLKDPELKGVVEEKPVPRRVCDEAYLMLRKLFAHKEDEETLMTNERMFLSMSNEERDKEIERLKSSEEWISLSEKMNVEGEF